MFFEKVLLHLPLSIFEKELLTELNVAPAQLHPNIWAFIRAFIILCSRFGISPFVEVFLYFFEAKHTSSKMWVSLNSAPKRALLTLDANQVNKEIPKDANLHNEKSSQVTCSSS